MQASNLIIKANSGWRHRVSRVLQGWTELSYNMRCLLHDHERYAIGRNKAATPPPGYQ